MMVGKSWWPLHRHRKADERFQRKAGSCWTYSDKEPEQLKPQEHQELQRDPFRHLRLQCCLGSWEGGMVSMRGGFRRLRFHTD